MSSSPTSPTPRPARPKYQVFVSSTFTDLHEARKSVTWEILKAGHIPVGMENFSAYDDRGWKVIEKTLKDTDYYVLLLAGRYGSIDETGMSWTEREYRRAMELGIPVLAFVRQTASIPGDQIDKDEGAKRLEAFAQDVDSRRMREKWTTEDDLKAKVGAALYKIIQTDEEDGALRPGWYRGNQLPSLATSEELAKLSAENRALRDQVQALTVLHVPGKELLITGARVLFQPLVASQNELCAQTKEHAQVLAVEELGVILSMIPILYGKYVRSIKQAHFAKAGETRQQKIHIPWRNIEGVHPDPEDSSLTMIRLSSALVFDRDQDLWSLS